MSREKQNTPTNTPTYTNLHQPCKSVQSGDCKNCNNHIEEMAKIISQHTVKNCEAVPFADIKKMHDGICIARVPSCGSCKGARALYNAGYRKQSEVIEEYRQRVNAKMGKHTHLLGKEYVQRILREVAKEMKGGAE